MAKVMVFVLMVLLTEGTKIRFVMLELLESMLLELSKLCLIPDILERKGERISFYMGP